MDKKIVKGLVLTTEESKNKEIKVISKFSQINTIDEPTRQCAVIILTPNTLFLIIKANKPHRQNVCGAYLLYYFLLTSTSNIRFQGKVKVYSLIRSPNTGSANVKMSLVITASASCTCSVFNSLLGQ